MVVRFLTARRIIVSSHSLAKVAPGAATVPRPSSAPGSLPTAVACWGRAAASRPRGTRSARAGALEPGPSSVQAAAVGVAAVRAKAIELVQFFMGISPFHVAGSVWPTTYTPLRSHASMWHPSVPPIFALIRAPNGVIGNRLRTRRADSRSGAAAVAISLGRERRPRRQRYPDRVVEGGGAATTGDTRGDGGFRCQRVVGGMGGCAEGASACPAAPARSTASRRWSRGAGDRARRRASCGSKQSPSNVQGSAWGRDCGVV